MKRKVALLLALVLACSMFAGCKQDPANTTTGEPAPSTTAGNQEEPTTPAAEPAGPVELNVVTTYAGEDTNAGNFQDAVKAWEAATGNTVIDGSATSNEQFKAQLRADFEMGAEPDVLFFFNGVDSNSFIDKVVSIDEIRAEYPEYATNMKDGMMGASPVDGKNYSVPVNGYWEGLFVNKTVLAAAGVDVPGADYTWDQFMTDCAKIKEAGYVPVAASLKEIPHYWFEFTIYNHLTPATHNILPGSVDDEHGKAWVAGIGDIKSMYEAGCFPANTLTATDAETFQLFIEDKAAFLIDGSWKTGGIESAFADADGKVDPEKIANFTVTYVPGMNNRKASDIIGGLSSGYFITKKAWADPAKRAAAVSFVEHMTSDEMVSKFAGVSATALVNGVQVDEATLSSLGVAGLAMVKGATGMAGAVQDQVLPDCRGPIFSSMDMIVEGETPIEEAVQGVLDLVAEAAQ